jgi:hypothetical protein
MQQHLLVKHTLDVMQCEKNIWENLLKVIFMDKNRHWLFERTWKKLVFNLSFGYNKLVVGQFIKPFAPYVMFDNNFFCSCRL